MGSLAALPLGSKAEPHHKRIFRVLQLIYGLWLDLNANSVRLESKFRETPQ